MITHPIAPVFDKESRVLILGSFPSVKSREAMFFYGHPQNRFWKVIATVCNGGEDIPYFQGCDPGVSFISEYNPNKNMISVYVSNYGDNVWKIARDIRNALI